MNDNFYKKEVINNKNKIVLFLLTLITLVFSLSFSLNSVFAHKAVQTFAFIDTHSMTLQTSSSIDKNTVWGQESAHDEYKLGDFWIVSPSATEDSDYIKGLIMAKGTDSLKVENINKGMKFGFPYKGYSSNKGVVKVMEGGGWIAASKDIVESVVGVFLPENNKKIMNDVTGAEIEHAILVSSSVVNGLNEAMAVIYKGQPKPQNAEEFFQRARNVLNNNVSGWTITLDEHSGADKSGIRYARITNGKSDYAFPFAMAKGYKPVTNFNGGEPLFSHSVFTAGKCYENDADFLGWGDFIYIADYIYQVRGVTTSNTYDLIKVNPVEKYITEVFENLIYTVQSALGLYTTEDLVFLSGVRGQGTWMYGIMPKSWFPTILNLHLVFQSLAWSILVIAFIKILIDENMATMNPMQRQGVYESIKNLAITFFLLLSVFPIFSFIMQISATFSVFFGSYVPAGFLSGGGGQSGALGNILIMIVYLMINIYLNIVYIVRAIMISMLLITAPLFVVSIAFGPQWKVYYSFWFKELLSNICLQPVHALTMGSLAMMASNARGIERLVFAMSVVFVTNFYQNVLLQGGAGTTIAGGSDILNRGQTVAGGVMGSVFSDGGKKSSGANSPNGKSSGEKEETKNKDKKRDKEPIKSDPETETGKEDGYGGKKMNTDNGDKTKEKTKNEETKTEPISAGEVEKKKEGKKEGRRQIMGAVGSAMKETGSGMLSAGKAIGGAGAAVVGAGMALSGLDNGMGKQMMGMGIAGAKSNGLAAISSMGEAPGKAKDIASAISNHNDAANSPPVRTEVEKGQGNHYDNPINDNSGNHGKYKEEERLNGSTDGYFNAEMYHDDFGVDDMEISKNNMGKQQLDVSFDLNNMSSVQKEEIETIMSWDKSKQKSHGIESIIQKSATDPNKVTFSYNEATMEKMGMNNVTRLKDRDGNDAYRVNKREKDNQNFEIIPQEARRAARKDIKKSESA